MSQTKSYKRNPAIKCWVEHLLEGKFSNEKKMLYTIFGPVKRVRLVGTITDKREIVSNPIDNDEDMIGEDEENLRIEFDLDDGTGTIRATLWSAEPEKYENYLKGDIVELIGLIRQYREYTYVSPEIIKKIDEPNYILLQKAEIIKKIKKGETQEIPDDIDDIFNIDEIPSDIDVAELFDEDNLGGKADIKEKIYEIIEKKTTEGDGISLEDLQKILSIESGQLRNYINDLEMESRIYQAEENIFQTF